MDGSRPEVLVSKGVGWPNALAIDYATGEVFFGDAREDYIAAMNQDGSALRKILSRSILNPGARDPIQFRLEKPLAKSIEFWLKITYIKKNVQSWLV